MLLSELIRIKNIRHDFEISLYELLAMQAQYQYWVQALEFQDSLPLPLHDFMTCGLTQGRYA